MSIQEIRKGYGLNIKRGMRTEYCGHDNIRRPGRVCGASGPYVSIRLDGERKSRRYHPKDPHLVYLPGQRTTDEGSVVHTEE